MTDNNLVEVALILDRSGSMGTIARDMEGGIKTFVEEQRKQAGRCVISLYQFDDRYDVVFEERDVNDIPNIILTPRGGTALLDAVGKSIVKIGERLAKKPEHERPSGVVVMIVTDGHENASKEWSNALLKSAVERQEREYKWKFVFLGADMRAFEDARKMGITISSKYTANSVGTKRLFNATSGAVRGYRGGMSLGGPATAILDIAPIIHESEECLKVIIP